MEQQPQQVQIQPSKEALEKAKNAHEYSMNLLNQMMQQMWQIISQTPAAQPFLRSFLTAAFPDEGVHWAKVVEDDQTCKLLLQQCAMMLKNIVMSRPEELKSLPPEQVQQLVMLEQQVAQVLGQPQQATA